MGAAAAAAAGAGAAAPGRARGVGLGLGLGLGGGVGERRVAVCEAVFVRLCGGVYAGCAPPQSLVGVRLLGLGLGVGLGLGLVGVTAAELGRAEDGEELGLRDARREPGEGEGEVR